MSENETPKDEELNDDVGAEDESEAVDGAEEVSDDVSDAVVEDSGDRTAGEIAVEVGCDCG